MVSIMFTATYVYVTSICYVCWSQTVISTWNNQLQSYINMHQIIVIIKNIFFISGGSNQLTDSYGDQYGNI